MPEVALESKLPLPERYLAEYLEYNGVLPLDQTETHVRVAVCGEPALEVLDDIEREFGLPLECVAVSPEDLVEGVRRAYAAAESIVELVKDLDAEGRGAAEESDGPLADARDLATQPPVIRFVNLLIKEAHNARASDIHLDAEPGGLHTRFRIDGVLNEIPRPPRELQAAIVSRVKLISDLDIAERRLPQDGRVRIRLEQRELDLRVSTMPTMHGESVVLRLLDRGGRPVELDELGMAAEVLGEFKGLAARPHGIVLATGPTGSGKTTTLYAALGLRNARQENLITIEDPVEYAIAGVRQVVVNPKIGMTFASALRSVVRQDPDVVMIGEMRDAETAGIAIQAAMTGQLVFSTLHTNDAASAVTRLVDLQVPPYMIAATVEAVLAQRLVRKICPDCREEYVPRSQAVAQVAQRPVGTLHLERGRGCPTCRGTGYFGRTGIFELLVVTDTVKDAIVRGATLSSVRELAEQAGMRTLRADGWTKVERGVTTVEEVLRVTQR